MSQDTQEQMKLDASIIKEAAEVLQMVADSGVTLPPNWRWPLLDELSGIAYAMQDAATLRQAAWVDEEVVSKVWQAIADHPDNPIPPSAVSVRAALEATLSAQPLIHESGAISSESGQPAERQGEVLARPMETAPRDGTMLRLLVRFTEHATEDAEEAWTIGSNSFDANGEDVWQFAGWCWTHDHFTEGKGTPVGWLPMLGERARVPEGMVLVPREPTPEMIAACIACWQERLNRKAAAGTLLCGGNPERSFRENWAAMLAAAPPAPQGVE